MLELFRGLPGSSLLYAKQQDQPKRPVKQKKSVTTRVKPDNGHILFPGLAMNPFSENAGNQKLEIFDQPFELRSSDFKDIGERDLWLAASRMGKSNGMGAILEQYLDQEFTNQYLGRHTGLKQKGIACIIDPQGEWYTLQDAFPVVVVGGNIQGRREYFMADEKMPAAKKKLRLEQLDKRIPMTFRESDYKIEPGMDKEDKAALFERKERDVRELELLINNLVRGMLTKGFTLIFDLTYQVKTSDKQFIACVIIEAVRRHNNALRRKMKFVIDEVHNFAPQSKPCASSELLIAALKEGAKEGIDFMLATQSCASLSKEIVKQILRFFLGAVREQNDVNAIASFFGKGGSVDADKIKTLPRYVFYYLFEGNAIKFKPFLRKLEHGGRTPEFKTDAQVATKDDIDGFLKNIKAAR